jgi:4-hydroxy-tetrahydrodipicolinate reductase
VKGATAPLRLLIVGHGRMGRLVDALAAEHGMQVAGRISSSNAGDERWPDADVAIDFSTASAVAGNAIRLAERGTNLVIGTTGWQEQEAELREALAGKPIGVVAAPNFALGVNIFLAIAERAAELMAERPEFGAWIHELHHRAKRDAPSGTALAIREVMERAGYRAPIDVASTRVGSIPGTHTVGFDSSADTITLTHTARDRSVFARGALEAARWVHGRRGWFSMKDVLGLSGV